MGGVVSSLFGGSKNSSSSNSSSYNQAYNYLNGALSPAVSAGTNALGAENQLLTSDQSNSPAFQNYLNSTGYNFQLKQGEQGVTNNAAVKGMLNSGATAKALTDYNQNAASGAYQNYLTNLNSVASTGLGAANTIAGAGQVSNSSSTGKGSSTGGIIPGLFG